MEQIMEAPGGEDTIVGIVLIISYYTYKDFFEF